MRLELNSSSRKPDFFLDVAVIFRKAKARSSSTAASFRWDFRQQSGHAENEVPQPQVPVALGLANLKPPP
jgi:hypothetical protein